MISHGGDPSLSSVAARLSAMTKTVEAIAAAMRLADDHSLSLSVVSGELHCGRPAVIHKHYGGLLPHSATVFVTNVGRAPGARLAGGGMTRLRPGQRSDLDAKARAAVPGLRAAVVDSEGWDVSCVLDCGPGYGLGARRTLGDVMKALAPVADMLEADPHSAAVRVFLLPQNREAADFVQEYLARVWAPATDLQHTAIPARWAAMAPHGREGLLRWAAMPENRTCDFGYLHSDAASNFQ